jgi:hypothetical protein
MSKLMILFIFLFHSIRVFGANDIITITKAVVPMAGRGTQQTSMHHVIDPESGYKKYVLPTIVGTIALTFGYVYQKWFSSALSRILPKASPVIPDDFEQKVKAEFDKHQLIPYDYQTRKTILIGDDLEFKKFIEKFGFSPEQEKTIIIPNEHFIYTHFYPGYMNINEYNAERYNKDFFIKDTNYTRIINCARIEKIIKSENLLHIGIPRKYITLIGDRWNIVAEKIDVIPPKNWHLTTAELQELIKFILVTKFNDFESINIVKNKDRKIIFIDTGNRSFGLIEKNIGTDAGNLTALKKYLSSHTNNTLLNLLDEAIKKASTEYTQEKPLSERTDLDDSNMNVEKIKNYFKQFSTKREKWYEMFPGSKQFFIALKKEDEQNEEAYIKHVNEKQKRESITAKNKQVPAGTSLYNSIGSTLRNYWNRIRHILFNISNEI